MKASTTLALAASAGVALAQQPGAGVNYTSILDQYLSPQCQQTIAGLGNSSIAQCLHVDTIPKLFVPIFTQNSSIIPPIDEYLAELCYEQPCSNATLQSTAQTIINGCAADLAKYQVPNNTITFIFDQYPLVREVACLKTTAPFNATNASIPITNPPYNLTNGTFCITSLLTEVSSVLGANLTEAYILNAYLSQNQTALNLVESLFPTIICSDCFTAALDIVELAYPGLANVTIPDFSYGNISIQGNNATVNQYLNATCKASNYTVDIDGVLPPTIFASAINSTFPYPLTWANGTNATAAATKRDFDITAMKRRWIGQQ